MTKRPPSGMGWAVQYDLEPIACAWCGTQFKPLTREAKYCKPQCRQNYNNDVLSKKRAKARAKKLCAKNK